MLETFSHFFTQFFIIPTIPRQERGRWLTKDTVLPSLWFLIPFISVQYTVNSKGWRSTSCWDIVMLEAACEGKGRSWSWGRQRQAMHMIYFLERLPWSAGDHVGAPAMMLKLALSSVGPREHRSESTFSQLMSLTNICFVALTVIWRYRYVLWAPSGRYVWISLGFSIAIDNFLQGECVEIAT
jgi:hypothetical protein